MNPKFWAELTMIRLEEPVTDGQVVEEDDIDVQATWFDDDSDLSCETIIAHVHGHQVDGVEVQGGHLVFMVAMETIDYNREKLGWADDVATASRRGA
jgi:hypothetical protein